MKITNIDNILEQAKELGHEIEVVSLIGSGKEAVVYRALLDGKMAAMKVYKDPEERSFKKAGQYLEGKHYKKESERKAVAKGNVFGKKLKYENWIKREFFMIEKLYALGAKIPKPIVQIENAIFMEFLGDKDGAAPRLCDVKLTEKEAVGAFNSIIKSMIIFWNFGIVHADLSEYNILWWNSQPYLIDFPQSVDRKLHPNPTELLERDLRNVIRYFSKFMKIDYDEIRGKFKP